MNPRLFSKDLKARFRSLCTHWVTGPRFSFLEFKISMRFFQAFVELFLLWGFIKVVYMSPSLYNPYTLLSDTGMLGAENRMDFHHGLIQMHL